MSPELLALLDSSPATGILVAADELEHEAGRCADAEGAFRWTDPADGARLVEWMRASARRWREVVQRHEGQERAQWVSSGLGGMRGAGHLTVCIWCGGAEPWPCPDVRETAAEARAFLGGKP